MKKRLVTIVAAGAVAAMTGVASAEKSLEQRVAELEQQIAANKGAQDSKGSVGNVSLSNFMNKTTIGGYGEVHYNNVSGYDDEIDFHRFVLFFGHKFNDKIRFNSELEIEHADTSKEGAVELEQAYIEMDLNNDLQVRAGLMLVPVGIMNETHEPPTFFGVERNIVENRIIPTTWREAGVSLTKKFDNGLSLDGMISSGLNVPTSGSNAGRIRSGRTKVSEAIADSAAFTGRVTYVGYPGLKVSAFGQFNTDVVQNDAGSESGVLYGATAEYQNGGFALRALYAKWDIDGTIPEEAKSQSGWYVEPSYTFDLQGDAKVGFFARLANTDYYRGGSNDEEVLTVGVNYWPIQNVVFKADYQVVDVDGARAGTKDDANRFNLGVGYQF